MTENQKKYEVAKKEPTAVEVVGQRIKALQSEGEIHFPPDYSPQNALRSAWLILQNTQDRNKRPALSVCTKASVYNALFDMVITGLNPEKKQGYFIVYGNQLAFQRSYFGSEALAKRVDPEIAEIVAEPVYEADDFEFEIVKGKKVVTKHKQTIESINSKKPKAAYCMVLGHDGNVRKTEIMTYEEIKSAWAKSKMNPITDKGTVKPGSTHDEFMAEMIRKTVINRTCKPIFNSSDDKYLKLAANRSDVVRAESDSVEEIDEFANQDVIDIDPEPQQITEAPEPENPTQAPDPGRAFSENKPGDYPPDHTARNSEDFLKNSTGTKSAPTAEAKPGNGTTTYLSCPKSKSQARKPIGVCGQCKDRGKCDPYKEYQHDQQPDGSEAGEGPDF